MIEFIAVQKRFGDCVSLKDCSFQVERGTIHAIIGENGAGKSTAMKILFGMHTPSSGVLKIDGKEVRFDSPTDAMTAGIGMVHQHFMLAEPITALDNILLQTRTRSPFSKLPRKQALKHLQSLANKYNFEIDLLKSVDQLSVGEQQRVEILKVLSQDAEIIILDEPTAVLTPQEVQALFSNLQILKASGKTILIITHKLKEVKAISDNITVLRAGTTVAHFKTQDVQIENLAEAMVGRRLHKSAQRSTSIDTQSICLDVRADENEAEWSLKIHSKEIVGVAGIEGNGQKEFIDWLYKRKLDRHNKKQAVLHFGAFPEDRLRLGVLPNRPVFENFILGRHRSKKFLRSFFYDLGKILRLTRDSMEKFDVRPRDPLMKFSALSGGNQQKLVVARELLEQPDFVLAAQPTRGVDIGAIEFIHDQLRKARDRGAGILLISSELDELLDLSDRILVLYKGRFVAEFTQDHFDEVLIGKAMGGGLT